MYIMGLIFLYHLQYIFKYFHPPTPTPIPPPPPPQKKKKKKNPWDVIANPCPGVDGSHWFR